MRKQLIKTISLCTCTALLIGCIGASAFAKNSDQPTNEQPQKMESANFAKEDCLSKDETIYILAGADGSVNKIIVSDWLKELTKGTLSYSVDPCDMKVWDVEGNDVYFQGDIQKELPVDLSVSYKLDGKNISVDSLVGKSGKVTIRFDYNNKQYKMTTIDGKAEKIYVPFAMLTGMLLNNNIFKNVEVSGGKLINDGNRTAVIGIAFPGMQDNLGIDRDTFEIPDYIEITADVTDFQFGMTVTVATNELFNSIDTDKLNTVDDLDASLNQLTDGMNQLIDGSSKLYDGICTLLDKSNELVSGINQLADGASKLKNGAADLDAGAGRLQAGAAELSAGLGKLSANSQSLNGGARQVFETLLSTAYTQLTASGLTVPALTIDNYSAVLTSTIASLDSANIYNQALQVVENTVEENRPAITLAVTAAIRTSVGENVSNAIEEQVTAQVTNTVYEQVASQVILAATGLSKEAFDTAVSAGGIDTATQQAISAAIDAQMATQDVLDTIATNVNAQMSSTDILSLISARTEEQMQSEHVRNLILQNVELQVAQAISDAMASPEVQAKLAQASAGAQSVIALKTSLDSYNTFYLGLCTYTAGVDTASAGAAQLAAGTSDLKKGTSQFKTGANQLCDGILELKKGVPALLEGVTQLKDGAMQLSDGLKQYNEEGIQKLVSLLGDNLKSVATRLKATMDVSKDYKSFSNIANASDGKVKFIYRTEEIR